MSFHTQDLQRQCISISEAEKALGRVNSVELFRVIAEIEAQANGQELLAFLGEDALVGEDDTLTISLSADRVSTFIVAGKQFQKDDDGRVRWESVTRLKLMSIEGCHGCK